MLGGTRPRHRGANRVRFDDLDRQLIERIAAERHRSSEEEEVIAA
jgi:hypothetical protein